MVLADLTAQAGSALGSAVGGLVALHGGGDVFVIAAVPFGLAATSTLFLPLPGRSARPAGGPPTLMADVLVAVWHLTHDARLSRLFGASCAMWAAWDIVGAHLRTRAGSPAAAGLGSGAFAVTTLIVLRTGFGGSACLGGGAYTRLVLNAPPELRARMSTLLGSVGAGRCRAPPNWASGPSATRWVQGWRFWYTAC